MTLADLKNDFVFRRVFATHPDILRGLLNDLLERSGDRVIDTIEYLPIEQPPLALGAKLSLLDVKCRDRGGNTFVVEMQLIHVPGFINRVVYNECKADVGQLKQGERYTRLADVVAITIPAWLPVGPYRQAVELANSTTFSQGELDAYQQVVFEIEQAREYRDVKDTRGRAEGKAEAILTVLAARCIPVRSDARERIMTCTDIATLDGWIARVVTASSANEVVAGDRRE